MHDVQEFQSQIWAGMVVNTVIKIKNQYWGGAQYSKMRNELKQHLHIGDFVPRIFHY